MHKRDRILVFLDYYLPGYKAGGPIRAIQNLIENLSDRLDFFIVTRNRDQGGEHYPNLENDRWLQVERARVMYTDEGAQKFISIARQIKRADFRFIYLNSFFSFSFSIFPLTFARLTRREMKIIIAPRGEFNAGALKIKPLRKSIFIAIVKIIGLHNNVLWQASTDTEVDEIQKIFPKAKCKIAKELTPAILPSKANKPVSKKEGELKVIFISRISRKKNLDFAIEVISGITEGKITFDIYGPIEDIPYWNFCRSKIRKKNSNVAISHKGDLKHTEVMDTLSAYHVFFLPTHGENFGYVILEALLSGRPVIISDLTPWRNLVDKNIGYDLALNEPDRFRSALKAFLKMDQYAYDDIRRSIKSYMDHYLLDFEQEIRNSEKLFSDENFSSAHS